MGTFDVVIVGGGAAGLMCAIAAGNRGRRVLVVEKSNKIGKKILMSGGGRCNFTNLDCGPANFVSANRHFCKSALSRFTPADFLSLVEKHNIPYHEKTAGQLFCDRSSKDILAMLTAECDAAGVRIITHCDTSTVTKIRPYQLATNRGSFTGESLVIASGGLSIPKMGASDFGYKLAHQFGLKIRETRAALVPFTFTGATHELTARLSGVSVRGTVAVGDRSFTDDLLFTHRGLSGPAALQASSYWVPGEYLCLDIFPDERAEEWLLRAKSEQPQSLLRTALATVIPRSLVAELEAIWWADIATTPLAAVRDDSLRRVATMLHNWRVKPSGTEGYRTAEVTLGGVDTDALSSKTMEVRQQPGLYFIGEVVDVTGQLGGFNFQWAWASAWAAGQVA
ncbi:MAG: NAD(P)/FAD-dependent oxidoreductase [Woeseiaceae bacterium]